MGKMCTICGKPTGTFVFCKEHQKEKEEGKIIKCPICNTWRKVAEKCPECGNEPMKCIDVSKSKQEVNNNVQEIDKLPAKLNCIICGKDSNGMHFCKECYYKYKDRAIDIRISNCSTTEILDEYGNRTKKCKDGRWVRSKAEKIINDFLFDNRIRAVYEQIIYYKEDNQDKKLKPDFFLPDYNVYLEYNGLTNKAYLNSKSYTQRIYDSLNKQVIIMVDKDLDDIEAFLKPKLGLN